jgi:ubiquinol-cytochrome c reductase iron-sulfur subunit
MAGPASEFVAIGTAATETAHAAGVPSAQDAGHAHAGPRRDFLKMTLAATAVVGLATAIWPFLDTMDPSKNVMRASDVSVDLSGIPAGTGITVMWKGKPVLVRHRTPAEVTALAYTDTFQLRDPATDLSRVKTGHAEWVVMFGTGPDGCVVTGNQPSDNRGKWGGYVSPCDGSEYDTSGRVRSGPAKTNLPIPPYDFVSATKITIG